MNRHQQAVVEYLQEDNRILLEQLGGKPKRFTDAQRARWARKAKVIGCQRLRRIPTLVTPETLLRWFRVLVAQKWTFPNHNLVGQPAVDPKLEKLVLQLIQDNPTWGSKPIVGALDNLGPTLSDSTLDNIRRRNGLDPAPTSGSPVQRVRGALRSFHQARVFESPDLSERTTPPDHDLNSRRLLSAPPKPPRD